MNKTTLPIWSRPRGQQLASANSRCPFRFRKLEEIRCSLVLSVLGSPAAVAERERSPPRLTHDDMLALHHIIAGEIMDQGTAGRCRTISRK